MELKHLYKNNNVDDEWLQSCIQYLRTTLSIANNQELLKQTQLQFINSDLGDSTQGGIGPAARARQQPVLFPSPSKGILLQIVSITDIGVSAYSLTLNKDQKSALKLTLSDGYTHLDAFEYQPIQSLSINTPLGCKLLIKNAEMLQGTVLLTPANTTVKGGKIEELDRRRDEIVDGILNARLGKVDESVRNARENAPRNTTSNAPPEIIDISD